MAKLTQSLLNMAEAMLEDEYKASHTDLKEWGEEKSKKREAEEEQDDIPALTSPDEETREDVSDDKKFESRSVVIQVPPKRQKIANVCTAREVVDGKVFSIVMS